VEQAPSFTWDGLPVASDEPHGASIVVRRAGPGGARHEYLLLHRAHRGPGYAGDWAWTPPAGSRLPGEPVLTAALRELAEESGLRARPADLRAIDLRGQWAVFALDVPAGTLARVDPEHDRLDWVSLDEASRRCRPAVVADGLRRAAAAGRPATGFRPLGVDDLPSMVEWRRAAHVARWFGPGLELPAVARKYGPRIAGDSPTRVDIALADGLPCGFAQCYRVGAYPEYAAATGDPDAIGIDYAIGVRSLTGHGFGPQLIWQYVLQVVRAAYPEAATVVASPAMANEQSIRALEKAGFRRIREIVGASERSPELLCALDLRHFLGSPD
jgi:8-oxo-dGTP pyrophosphatase MutT (NUDIX family)/RimJ/RimL family protein N-acetyltransferase